MDDRPDAAPIALISEDLWRTTLGAETAAVGGVLRVNGRPFTVVGIVPRTFVGITERVPAVWIPMTQHAAAFPGSNLLEDWTGAAAQFYGRVPGGDVIAVEAELRGAVDALRRERPRTSGTASGSSSVMPHAWCRSRRRPRPSR